MKWKSYLSHQLEQIDVLYFIVSSWFNVRLFSILGIFIVTFSCLASKMALADQIIQDFAGLDKSWLDFSFLGPAINNEFGCIQTNKLRKGTTLSRFVYQLVSSHCPYIGQFNGTHGHTSTQFHSCINVFSASLSAFQYAESFHHVRYEKTVDNEAAKHMFLSVHHISNQDDYATSFTQEYPCIQLVSFLSSC